MFVDILRAVMNRISDEKSLSSQVALSGFVLIPLSDLTDPVLDDMAINKWDFIRVIDEVAGEFNAQFAGIYFGCLMLRRINNAAADDRDVNPVRDQDCQPETDACCNQTGESSCGNMRSLPEHTNYISNGAGIPERNVSDFAKPDDAECVFQLQRGQNGDWSVAGQTTGMAWLGKDPLYALAAFLGRDDVCRFMEDAGRKKPENLIPRNYREPEKLPAKGERISVYKKRHNTTFRDNSFAPSDDGIPMLSIALNGSEWTATDILIVQPDDSGEPRYFTRIYPELKEGDVVFAESSHGIFRIAFMHQGVLTYTHRVMSPRSQVETVCVGELKDPLVLGVEIDKENIQDIINQRVFSGHSN